MEHIPKYLTLCIIAGAVLSGRTASAQVLTLIDPTTNDGSFESITGKSNFSSPASGSITTDSIPFWGATLQSTTGAAVGAPSDSGAQIGGGVAQDGVAGSFYQPGGSSTAFNLVTTRAIATGDQYTLTWYASAQNGSAQVVTLFSQATATATTGTYVYDPTATLATLSGNLTGGFAQYTLTYTATAADAGNYIGLTFGNGNNAGYESADNFVLQVTPVPEPATYIVLLACSAGLLLARKFHIVLR